MATAVSTDFISIVASEMSSGVERAVKYWLAQIDQIVANDTLAPYLKLAAIRGILQNYKGLAGKES
ncbi:MAG: hypothetical protein ACRD2U_03615 [Terriglobales bacterium]